MPVVRGPDFLQGRTYDEGKKIGVKDGMAAFWYVIKFNLFCSLASSYRVVPRGEPMLRRV